jgi:hypothetical protein
MERRGLMYRFLLTTTLALAGLAALATAGALAGDGPLPAELQEVRAAVARYHSIEQATRDGYVRTSPCESSPAGTMGHHYANFTLMADATIDPLRPEVLLYLPDSNGNLKLVAVEYFKRDADGSLLTDGDRPFFFGQPFDGPMPGHNPAMPVHYDLHVWVAEENPNGVYAQWNPALRCP